MSDLLARNRASRDAILARIRVGVGRGREALSRAGDPPAGMDAPRPGGLQRHAAGSAPLRERFVRFALASSSTLDEVTSIAAVPAAVARYLAAQGLPPRAVLWAELEALDWSGAGVEVAARAANGDDAVGITGVFCALAETGTLLTLSGPETAASTSLLPETHIAVVAVSRIVAGMEEAFALVVAERGEMPRALNFISGPSRTGDIEQTIVLGAHGPSRVHLVLVNDLA